MGKRKQAPTQAASEVAPRNEQPAAAVQDQPQGTQAASDTPPASKTQDQPPLPAAQASTQDAGNVPDQSNGSGMAARLALARAIEARLVMRKDWGAISPTRDQIIRECIRGKGMSKEEARCWAYSELDRMYPPLAISIKEAPATTYAEPQPADRGIKGLSKFPDDWPQLPAAASFTSEVSWVQANRLLVVEERPSGAVVVHLERARTPAPSMAALAWLETSIRSYAKWVEVASKCSGSEDLGSDIIKREKARIEDVRAVLAEMLEDRG